MAAMEWEADTEDPFALSPFASPWSPPTTLTRRRDTYPFIDPFRFRSSLTGKIAIVTQAHRGIGRATALALAAAGASVALVSKCRSSLSAVLSDIQSRHNTPTLAISADFSCQHVPKRVVELVSKNLGPVDILVNIVSPIHPIPFSATDSFSSDWWTYFERALKPNLALIHAVLPCMIARGSGTIISISVCTAALNLMPFTSAMSSSNAALINFHQHLHHEVAPKGICSYVVHPGHVASHFHDPEDEHAAKWANWNVATTSIPLAPSVAVSAHAAGNSKNGPGSSTARGSSGSRSSSSSSNSSPATAGIPGVGNERIPSPKSGDEPSIVGGGGGAVIRNGHHAKPTLYEKEPRLRHELIENVGRIEWSAAGLASDTVVTLCADEKCRVLSGRWINAEVDLGEVLERVVNTGAMEERNLYVQKVDQF